MSSAHVPCRSRFRFRTWFMSQQGRTLILVIKGQMYHNSRLRRQLTAGYSRGAISGAMAATWPFRNHKPTEKRRRLTLEKVPWLTNLVSNISLYSSPACVLYFSVQLLPYWAGEVSTNSTSCTPYFSALGSSSSETGSSRSNPLPDQPLLPGPSRSLTKPAGRVGSGRGLTPSRDPYAGPEATAALQGRLPLLLLRMGSAVVNMGTGR